MIQTQTPCPSCHRIGANLMLNYAADRARHTDAPGRWWVDCQTCWDEVKHAEPEPDYHVQPGDFMTADAATRLDDHLRGKYWFTETVQARMRAAVRGVLPITEGVRLDATPWPIPFGRDAAVEMHLRFQATRDAVGEPPVLKTTTFAELSSESSKMRTRIEGVEDGVFQHHGRTLDRLWSAAPEWLRKQLQKLDDRGVEAILRAFDQRDGKTR